MNWKATSQNHVSGFKDKLSREDATICILSLYGVFISKVLLLFKDYLKVAIFG